MTALAVAVLTTTAVAEEHRSCVGPPRMSLYGRGWAPELAGVGGGTAPDHPECGGGLGAAPGERGGAAHVSDLSCTYYSHNEPMLFGSCFMYCRSMTCFMLLVHGPRLNIMLH